MTMNERTGDISILVVDDETIIRKRIALHLEKAGYLIAGFAEDGKEAGKLIASLHPDIVITDIAMPFVSGIQLLEQARREGNTAHFIFITGYNDFDFAVSALKNRASDYLLKPIDPVLLLKAVERVCSEIVSERDQTVLATAYANLKEATGLYRFLSGEDILDSFSQDLQAILREPAGYRLLLVYGTDIPQVSPLQYLLPNGLQLLFVRPGETAIVGQFESTRWYLVLGNPLIDTADLRNTFPLLRRTLLQRFFTPEVHRYRQNAFPEELPFPADFTDQNRTLIERKHYARLRALLAEEVRALDNPLALETYTGAVSALFGEFSLGGQQFPWQAYSALWILERFENLEDFIGYLQGVASSLFPETDDAGMPLVDRIRAFLQSHYMEPQLSLETIGLRVFAHPNYVSTRFREETGMTVIEYLTTLRLDKARNLLQNTELSCKQVAFSVGFRDQGYFGKCFKKQYGYPPTDLRN